MPARDGEITLQGVTLDDVHTAMCTLELDAIHYAKAATDEVPDSAPRARLVSKAASCALVADALRTATGL